MGVAFTDGICHKCAARVRADHLRARFDGGASADRRETAWAPGLAALTITIVVALVLIARPTHELPAPPVVALLPPPPVVRDQSPSASVAPPLVVREQPEEPVVAQAPASPAPPPARPAARDTQLASATLAMTPRLTVAPVRSTGVRGVPPPRYAAQSP